MDRKSLKEYLQLFLSFLKIGAFTFGGGWAMISIIEREVVTDKKWIAKEEFLDLLAVAQSLPGILAVNIAVAVGNRIKGKTGSVVAAIGTIMPSFVIILLIAMYLTPETIKNNEILSRIFKGIRPAVVALIVAPVISSAKSAKINMRTAIIPVAVALLIYSGIGVISNPILYILLGGVLGVIYYSHKQQKTVADKKEEG
ncbi:MAG: chromate transporter [Muribaculaceae bacterium]|nr:chromate transporter [Muribaculaceae bacterium]